MSASASIRNLRKQYGDLSVLFGQSRDARTRQFLDSVIEGQ